MKPPWMPLAARGSNGFDVEDSVEQQLSQKGHNSHGGPRAQRNEQTMWQRQSVEMHVTR